MKRQVECEVGVYQVDNGKGYMVDATYATCPRCGKVAESFGTTQRSVRRCLAVLSKDCPNNEKNYYV